MPTQAPKQDEERGRVVLFRARRQRSAPPDQGPVPGIDKYTSSDAPDDYRHRMRMNALAVAVVMVLIGCGVWIIDAMAEMRKTQDCVLSGRRNCAPVTIVQPLNR